eukprot:1196347-Prorocentrum_minimum.AAC.6
MQVRECARPHVQARGCEYGGVCACAGTGLLMWGCVRMCRQEAAGVCVCAHVQAARHGAVDVGVCAHVQARGCGCGGVCACAGTGLWMWGCVRMCRHGAVDGGVSACALCRHRAACVGVCAHVQARGCSLRVWVCVRMCRHGAVDVGVCAHVQAQGCMCGGGCACAGKVVRGCWGVCAHVHIPRGCRCIWVCAHVQARCCRCVRAHVQARWHGRAHVATPKWGGVTGCDVCACAGKGGLMMP